MFANEWVFGIPTYDMKYMFSDGQMDSFDNYEIHPETVCQFTGEFDIEDNKIFEGDQLQHIKSFSHALTVNWSDEHCGFVLNNGDTSYNVNSNGLTVISNIHD